ncbi:MAG: hypothetical protein N2441_10405, partial [Rhodocyclaceae bacterium]|nr:hypothetical protein [Rhodocyclaceae bacterium]
YADDLENPRLVKIFDPNHLGVSCGFSAKPPAPGWVMSRVPPEAVDAEIVMPENRRRWWRRLFA